jgi:hypothetical protein
MESSSTPLADYFWIAGIEKISYEDVAPPVSPQVGDTIAEAGEADERPSSLLSSTSIRATARHSRQHSGSRLSKLSADGRFLDELDGNTRSNRSSATVCPPGTKRLSNRVSTDTARPDPPKSDAAPVDFDFDNALLKFAAERENFLEDLSFSAGAKIQSRDPMVAPPSNAKVKSTDDVGQLARRGTLIRSLRGTIRQKMSFRELNSVRKKQPTSQKPGISDS